MPETYGPVLLRRKAKKMRNETGNPKIVAPSELEKLDFKHLVVVVLTRPIRMFLFEAIVLFSCLYLSLAYGIFYGLWNPLGGRQVKLTNAQCSFRPSIPFLRSHMASTPERWGCASCPLESVR